MDFNTLQVFMLPSDALLDAETMKKVLGSGHSRVPVHRPGNRWPPCACSLLTTATFALQCLCQGCVLHSHWCLFLHRLAMPVGAIKKI